MLHTAQNCHLAPFFGDLSQDEKNSEIKPPLKKGELVDKICILVTTVYVYFAYSDDEDDIVGQDVNVQQHRVINDDILEEEESESITSVKMAT